MIDIHDDNMPLGALTIGEFRELMTEILSSVQPDTTHASREEPHRRYVYGLRGIKELFNVSTRTAQLWKDGILRDAVYQNGRTIVTDVDRAMELFSSSKGK